MYIDIEWLLSVSKLISPLMVIIGGIIGVYKVVERDKRQSKQIRAIQNEQTLICYGVLACLKGLEEQGCDGPVKAARNQLEKHLNKMAHGED